MSAQALFSTFIFPILSIHTIQYYMKRLFLFLFLSLLFGTAQAQIFDQILPLDQIIHNDKAYIVLASGDTLSGRLSRMRGGGKENRTLLQEGKDGIYRLTITVAKDEKVEVGLDSVKLLAIVPTLGQARFVQTNVGGDLMELNRLRKDPYIKKMMDGEKLIKLEPPSEGQDKWVFYQPIKVDYNRMKGSDKADFELRQLLNPTFDSRIKVFPEVPSEEVKNENSTEISGVNFSSNAPGSYLISIDNGPVERLQQFGYRKNGKAKVFKNCGIIESKPKWKDFALDVFKDHMECGNEDAATVKLK